MRARFYLPEDVIYLNHGSFGLCSKAVLSAWQEYQILIEREPCRFMRESLPGFWINSKSALGKFIEAPSACLSFLPSVTYGVNVVARSIRLRPGDEVLLSDEEYGACERVWQYIAAQSGATLKKIPMSRPGERRSDFIQRWVSNITAKTRILFLSHVSWVTGKITPIKELIRKARDSGVLTVIDGAHAPGHIHLSLSEANPDFYLGALHKWFGAPKGTAFLFAKPELHELIEPLVVGWGWLPERLATNRKSPLIAHVEPIGLRDVAAFLAVKDAADFLDSIDWHKLGMISHLKALALKDQIEHIPGVHTLVESNSGVLSQMFGVRLSKSLDAQLIAKRLYEDFKIETLGIKTERHNVLRFTVHSYNDDSELKKVPRALYEVCRRSGSSETSEMLT